MGKIKMKTKIYFLENIPKKKCRYCKSKDNLTYDHKIPLIRGGTSELSNIQVLCENCNRIKSNMTHNEMKRIMKWHTQILKNKEHIKNE